MHLDNTPYNWLIVIDTFRTGGSLSNFGIK